MERERAREVFGVVGGMGPLASAEFVKTIYEYGAADVCEQDAPVVMLYSDPTFPDRTDAFVAGADGVVLDQLIKAIGQLRSLGASKIVLCCMTVHYLLPKLPAELRACVISLLDVIFAGLAQTAKRHLLVCSTGTQKLRLFQNHDRWDALRDRIVLPDEDDQHRIHRDLIYPIKKNPDTAALVPLLESLLLKYRVDSFIVGCSEVHLIAKQISRRGARPSAGSLDPFAAVARRLARSRRP